jgi:hypothetical protein
MIDKRRKRKETKHKFITTQFQKQFQTKDLKHKIDQTKISMTIPKKAITIRIFPKGNQ